MEPLNFTTTVVVDESPEQVFNAVNNVRGWWSEEIEGGTQNLNDEFVYHYKDVHRSKMKLIEVIPNEKVVWLILDNYFKFTKNKSEWNGNKIIFEISRKDGQTHLQFTQLGLVPEYECYDICKDAWSNYITNSLRSLITIGQGQPNSKESEFDGNCWNSTTKSKRTINALNDRRSVVFIMQSKRAKNNVIIRS